MTGPSGRAGLPPVSFELPERTQHNGLIVRLSARDGREHFTYDLRPLPGTEELRRSIGEAIARLGNDGGSWQSMNTVRSGTASITRFLRWLDAQDDPPTSLDDLQRHQWNAWVLEHPARLGSMHQNLVTTVRVVLRASTKTTPKLRAALNRRTGKAPQSEAVVSYTAEELAAIRRAALRAVQEAEVRIASTLALLRSPAAGPEEDAAVRRLFQLKQPTLVDFKTLGAWDRAHGRAQPQKLNHMLFLTPHEAWACAVLLMCENGWNLSVIRRMTAPDDQAGRGDDFDIYTLDLVKPRRGRQAHMSNNLVDDGPNSPGRTIQRILNATQPARLILARQGLPADRLILWRAPAHRRLDMPILGGTPGINTLHKSAWVKALPHVSPQLLRRAYQARVKRAPTQNSRRVHEDVYLATDAQTREEAAEIIADGLNDALVTAHNHFSLRMLPPEDAPGSSQDTPVAACEDVHHHPLTGQICRESFLACLGCTNAVATPRHVPRLMYLLVSIDALVQVLPDAVWRTRWAERRAQLASLLSAHTSSAEREDALRNVTETEKLNVQRLLAGEFES